MSLRLRLLGGCWCARGEEPLRGFISQKARALLVYLAMEAGEHSRPELAALLWSEMPEASARTNLRQALANLRRLLGDDLTVTRHTVALNPDGVMLDVTAFTAAADAFHRQGEMAAGERAAGLYRGDFLAGLHVQGATGFETWMAVQREWLHEQAARLFYRLAVAYEGQGHYEQALTAVDRLLALEPWREEAHRQRMLILARLDRTSAAIRQYAICRQVLQDELGIEPGAATTALFQKIRRMQRGSSARQSLPPQATPFFGREAELARLTALLRNPEQRLITLVGMGGVGKTRLALEAARRARPAFLDGVTFLPLAPLSHPDALPLALSQALGLSPRADEDLHRRIAAHLHDQERLLILDNFEHLLTPGPNRALDLITTILQRAPQVTLLVTSQAPLRLRWERRFPLGGMAIPPIGDSSERAGEAARFFLHQARRVAPAFEPAEADWRAIQRICRLVEGLPLALELAAARMSQASPSQIAAELAQRMTALASPMHDAPARHRSLRAVFDHAWLLLSPEERVILPGLSLFPGGISPAAAQAVTGATAAQLAALAERSLLQRQEGERWLVHEALRAYLGVRLRVSGQERRLRQRHLDYFRELAQTQTAEPRPPDWLAPLQAEAANLDAALAFARETHQGEAGLALAADLWRFWDATGAWAAGRAWLETFLALAPEVDPELRGRALSAAGVLAWRQADFQAANRHHRAALALARERDDRAGRARALANLALVALDEGQPDWAMPLYQQSLAVFRALDDAGNMALALNNMGIIALHQGDFSLAQSYFQESLSLYRRLDRPRGVSWALGNLGNAARYQGQHQEAVRLYEEALALQRSLGDRYGEAVSLGNLGHALALEGRIDRAIALYQQAWELFEDMDAAGDMAETLDRLAAAHMAQGRAGEAARCLDRADALRRQHRLAIHPLEKPYRDAVRASLSPG